MNRTPTPRPLSLPLPPRRRGVALLLVLGVVVMASVLGYAMLSSAAMTKAASSNAAAGANAQSIAESGVNLAVYYLQKPESAPTYPAYPQSVLYEQQGGYWEGTGGQWVDLGAPSVGQVKVAVERDPDDRWQYRIVAYGRAPGSTLERRVEASMHVDAKYRFDYASVTNQDVTWGPYMRIEGNAYSNGGMRLLSGSEVLGKGIRRKNTSSLLPSEGFHYPSWAHADRRPVTIPTFDQVRSYLTYKNGGTAYNATVLTQDELGDGGGGGLLGGLLDLVVGLLFGSKPDNPSGVYYAQDDLTINSDVEVEGTLVVHGDLHITGDNIRFRAQPGLPALVVGGNMIFSSGSEARVEGVLYVAGRIDGSGVPPRLEVEGAMLVAGTSPIFPSVPLARVRVKHHPEKANVPAFSDVGRTPISIEVQTWEAR